MRKIISFDMDGTLFDEVFDEAFWRKWMFEAYAKASNMGFEEARKKGQEAYNGEGRDSLKWYDPNYWFSLFGIKDGWNKAVKELRHTIKPFPDTIPALESLSKKYDMILLSAANHEFIELKLSAESLKKYFKKIYSSTSDLGVAGKDKMVFRKLLKVLKIKPEQLIHVGDDYEFDYENS